MSRRLLSSSDRSTCTAPTACWLPAHNRSSRRVGLTAGLPARRPHRRGPRDVVDAWSPAKWLKQSPDAGAQRSISCPLGAKRRHPEKFLSQTWSMATTTAFSHVALACVDRAVLHQSFRLPEGSRRPPTGQAGRPPQVRRGGAVPPRHGREGKNGGKDQRISPLRGSSTQIRSGSGVHK